MSLWLTVSASAGASLVVAMKNWETRMAGFSGLKRLEFYRQNPSRPSIAAALVADAAFPQAARGAQSLILGKGIRGLAPRMWRSASRPAGQPIIEPDSP